MDGTYKFAVWRKGDSSLPTRIPHSSSVPWLHRVGGTTSGVCRSWEEGAYFHKSFLICFVCLHLCILSRQGWTHFLLCDLHNTERELRLPFMLGCSSQATCVRGEIERHRRISGPESKTEIFFGHGSPCFSEIQRESTTRGILKLAKHLNTTESGYPIVSDSIENYSLISGSSFHCML